MKRAAIAAALVLGIYAAAVGTGTLLYATGAIATGATHNDCAGIRQQIARDRGIDEEDVPQQDVKQATQTCLDGHTLTKREAFRSEYLFWSVWPGVICAVIYLLWPSWVRILRNQDAAEAAAAEVRLGQEHSGGASAPQT